MSTEIGAYNAKTHLPELLRQVSKGKSLTITNRGKPVARLVPTQKHANAALALQQMKTFMQEHRTRGVHLKALLEEGRR